MQPFTKQFPIDVWVVIVEMLQNPHPLPLSKPTGRQVFQQPHLAVLMRTAKFLQSIVEPLLYTRIYTDDLAELVHSYQLFQPGKRFSLTRRLYLEYLPRNEEPTYLSVCRAGKLTGLWEQYGLLEGWTPLAYKLSGDEELVILKAALDKLCRMGGAAKAFPKLESIAVDSTRAVGAGIWKQHQLNWTCAGDSQPLIRCFHQFNTFLASGSMKHVCMRSASGPLNFEMVSFTSEHRERSRRTFTPTAHFSSDTSQLMLALGCRSRWISDEPPGTDMADVLLAIGKCSMELVEHRSTLTSAWWTAQGQAVPSDTADIDIYCSTSYYGPNLYDPALAQVGLNPFVGGTKWFKKKVMSDTEKEAMVGKLQERVQAVFRKGSKMQDEFGWHVSEETPTCLACGTGVPAYGASTG